jgi:hypothetical protein
MVVRTALTLASLPTPFAHEIVELFPFEFEDLLVSLGPPVDGAATHEELAEELAIVSHFHDEIRVDDLMRRNSGKDPVLCHAAHSSSACGLLPHA